jgi:hypothetical protein
MGKERLIKVAFGWGTEFYLLLSLGFRPQKLHGDYR